MKKLHNFLLCCILLLWMSSHLLESTVDGHGNITDRLALLDFKNRITEDPLQIMTSWNDSVHFCNWFGVSCNPSNDRVISLSLESKKLAGSVPPSIGNLSYLATINFYDNKFSGQLPQELGRLWQLQHLNLTQNSFGGNIPSNLTHCKQLTVLEASLNNLIGEIPSQLSVLSKLFVLGLGGNNLLGTIPPWIGNFSSLFALSLALNNFHGKIPDEIGRIPRLGFFQLYGNYLSGTIPPSIYNISSIYYFSVAQNLLHGQLPQDVAFRFPNLTVFAGGANNFTGTIPISLSNASKLQVLDFAQNALTGKVSSSLGRLTGLIRLNFDGNKLGYGEFDDLNFITSLCNCTNLQVLGLGRNHFGGELPHSIANLSQELQIFTLGENLFHGNIPAGIENLINLFNLGFEGNKLTGNVPTVIGKLQKLQGLNLNYNRFSGPIPSSIGNLTGLTRLFMEENRFEGSIPKSLGNCQKLQNLNLSSNNLNGSIPVEVITLSSLSISLVLSNNYLTGPLPVEVGKLHSLMELDLSENKLSSEIPSSLGSCTSLERLHLEDNQFGGNIPDSLRNLRGIQDLDLSRNNLSGKVPEFLSKFLFLKILNLSYNTFQGKLSTEGIFANASAISVIGNDKLCGGIPSLRLPTCSNIQEVKQGPRKVVIFSTIAAILASLVLFSAAIFCIARNSRKGHSTVSTPQTSDESQVGISYSEIVRSTDGFSAENLIGSGSFGSVYKGMLPYDGTVVAIKVLNLQQEGASRSFIDECNALRSIRHRNLLRILTTCSSLNHQGNDFKALVFEFMPNGNLDEWLHPKGDEETPTKRLRFIQRLNIAIDIASGLDYLHHHCETTIVHCDLKPSNVLLDEDMTAHVGDFGLARFLLEESKNPSKFETLSVSLKGSIGYIPPEYGFGGEVSELGDVYSYGILLLEMFTGKRPTDEMFTCDLSIDTFVAIAEDVMAIVDQGMVKEEEDGNNETYEEGIDEKAMIKGIDSVEIEEFVISILKIGLTCCSTPPRKRMAINFVVNKLLDIRGSFLRSHTQKANKS